MRWQGQRESSNVEDRRGSRGVRAGGISLGTIVVALGLSWLLGVNPLEVLGLLSNPDAGFTPGSMQEDPASVPPADDEQARFVSTVLASTEDVWTPLFRERGMQYVPPKLVLFRGAYPTACGMGQAAMGPFYCPGDQKVYIDLSFYDTLGRQLNAPGEFAQAYVIAHEVGHHVQKLLGITDQMQAQSRRLSQTQYNALSVRLELQADCFAGLWAYTANEQTRMIEDGDIDAGLNAASQIGDDTLQRRSQGRVVPDSFTHGTSEQRQRWFRLGWEQGTIEACDTFSAQHL